MGREDCFLPFVDLTVDEFAEMLVWTAKRSRPVFVVTANAEILVQAERYSSYREALSKADFACADGVGAVLWLAARTGRRYPRVPGIDLAERLLGRAHEEGLRVFLYGTKPDVLWRTVSWVQSRFPRAKVVGAYPGYGVRGSVVARAVRERNPDFVFVALGVPKQEQWIAQYLPTFQRGVFMGVGGAFDVWAGVVPRAPVWMRRMGLEWFFRLLHRPVEDRWVRARNLLSFGPVLWKAVRDRIFPRKLTRSMAETVLEDGVKEPNMPERSVKRFRRVGL